MHLTSCPCRKAFNMTNIQDLVICTQVLWLACSINSTILHFWSLHTSTYVYGQSSRTLSHDFAAADPAEAMASKPSTCRNMGTWGTCTQQVKNDGQPHEPGNLKGFNLLSSQSHTLRNILIVTADCLLLTIAEMQMPSAKPPGRCASFLPWLIGQLAHAADPERALCQETAFCGFFHMVLIESCK